MVGEYVFTQHDVLEDITKPDSIGMASYQMDSHNVQRVVTSDGAVVNEGDMYLAVKPWEIPYRSLVPKRSCIFQSCGPLIPFDVGRSRSEATLVGFYLI